MGALVVLAAQAGSIEPGSTSETVVLVRNTGDTADTFHVSVEGTAAAWAVVEPSRLDLGPDDEAPAWVRFRPPRSPHTSPGRMPFTVVVESDADPEFRSVEPGVLDVGTFASVAAAVTSPPTTGARFTEMVVSVKNAGNRRSTVEITAESAGRDVSVLVTPSTAELGPGEGLDAVVRVRPPRRLLPGRAADRRVTVAVVSDGGALATLRPELSDEPHLASELFRSARVLLVVLVLLAIGGVLLLNAEPNDDTVDVRDGGARAILPSASTTQPSNEGEDDPNATPAPGDASTNTTESIGPNRPAAAPPLPLLAFVRVYGPDDRDVVVRQPGPRPTELRLRSPGSLESRPQLSPDRRHVAFVRERDASWKICVSSVNGGESVCVAEGSAASSVRWGNDGRTLYFTRASALRSIFFDVDTNVAGEDTDLGIAVAGGHFSLSPDGTRIAFAEGRRLQVRPVRGGGAGIHIDVPAPAEDPVWTPDSSRLVYASEFQIFSAPVGNGPIKQLTANGTVNAEPSCAAEGEWVIFRSNRSGTGDLYVVKASSSAGNEIGLAQVTVSGERELTPAF